MDGLHVNASLRSRVSASKDEMELIMRVWCWCCVVGTRVDVVEFRVRPGRNDIVLAIGTAPRNALGRIPNAEFL